LISTTASGRAALIRLSMSRASIGMVFLLPQALPVM
jgi:hypothetical protein